MPSKALYALAAQFRKANLWRLLGDDELFAISLPDGQTGYCCVMGMLGEHLALAVYSGDSGLASYRNLSEDQDTQTLAAQHERMFSQDCVMCSFEAKGDLDPRTVAEIRAYGLTFHGKQAYPMFQRMRPQHYPWTLDNPQDEAILATALSAALAVAHRLTSATGQISLLEQAEPPATKDSLGFTDGPPYARSIPLLVPRTDGTFAWQTVPLPAPTPPVYPSPSIEDALLLARIRKAKRTNAWACDFFIGPQPVAQSGTDDEDDMDMPTAAPFFPSVLIAVETDDGLVVHNGLAEPDRPETLVAALLDTMTTLGRPQKILVPNDRALALLSTAMAQAGIPIEKASDLPMLTDAEESFLASMQGGDAAPDEDMLGDMIEALLSLESADELPSPLREQLRMMSEQGFLPPDMQRTVQALFARAPGDEKATIHVLPNTAARSYTVSVSLQKGCYRHLLISATDTLWDLHRAILDAFDFEDDHLHAFFLDGRAWSRSDAYYDPRTEDRDQTTDAYTLAQVGLSKGKSFLYVFDFGDEWTFSCKVLREHDTPVDTPQVVRSVGTAPPQY